MQSKILDRLEPKNAGHDSIMEAVRGFCRPASDPISDAGEQEEKASPKSIDDQIYDLGNRLENMGFSLQVKATCSCCNSDFTVSYDIEGCEEGDQHYCGRSDRCMP